MKRYILPLILVLFSLVGFAQTNGNFKSVRFVNVLDSTTVLPIDATIYYNEQSNKFRAYENGAWKDLINTGGGFTNPMTTLGDIIIGGAAGTPTRLGIGTNTQSLISDGTNIAWANNVGSTNNAITTTLGVAQLGGNLNKNTDINGVNSYYVDFININQRLRVSGLVATFQGVQYLADYSANYTSRSLPDKGYVDGRTTLTSGYMGYGSGSNTLTGEGALTYDPTLNEIILADPTLNFSTSIFGGEIQLDDIAGGDDLTINDEGITSSGATAFHVTAMSSSLTLGHSAGNLVVDAVGTLSSGSYTPTVTLNTNASGVSATTHYYSRVGNTVSVNGTLAFTNTTGTAETIFHITLPVSTNLTSGSDLAGGGSMRENAGSTPLALYIHGDTTDEEAIIRFISPSSAVSSTVSYSFQYVIK